MKPYGYVRADGKGLFIYGDHQFTNNQNHDLIPVYTHPKDWVGLTDEEATEVYAETEEKVNEHWNKGGITMMFPPTLYKAIEAKLKEKNSA